MLSYVFLEKLLNRSWRSKILPPNFCNGKNSTVKKFPGFCFSNAEHGCYLRLDLPHFTLVGATTRAGLLTAPLRDRFGVIHHLEFYTEEELQTIIQHSAKVLGVEIDADGAREMAKRSRGTPRLANRLLKRVRDFAQVKYDGKITKEVADFALELLEVDRYGLDQTDRKILEMIIQKFNGGPVGLDTLAAAIGEDAGTIEDVYEPYLIQYGFLNRTPRGRVATELAYHHLGI